MVPPNYDSPPPPLPPNLPSDEQERWPTTGHGQDPQIPIDNWNPFFGGHGSACGSASLMLMRTTTRAGYPPSPPAPTSQGLPEPSFPVPMRRPVQLDYNPEILAHERTPFTTLGPLGERLRLAYLKGNLRPFELYTYFCDSPSPGSPFPEPPTGHASAWMDILGEPGFSPSWVEQTGSSMDASVPSEPPPLTSPFRTLHITAIETLSPLSSFDMDSLPISLDSIRLEEDIHSVDAETQTPDTSATPLSRLGSLDQDIVASLPSILTPPLHGPSPLQRNSTRRRSSSLGSDNAFSTRIPQNPGRRRSRSLDGPTHAVKGILRNWPVNRNPAPSTHRVQRSVRFAEVNSVRSSFDTEASTSRESSISISLTSFSSSSSHSSAGTARQFTTTRSSFTFASTSPSESALSSVSSSPSSRGYESDLESLALSLTPRLGDVFSPTQSPSSNTMTPPLMSLLQHYLDPESPGYNVSTPPPLPRTPMVELPSISRAGSEDNPITQIVHSISQSTSQLVGAVLCEEPQSYLPNADEAAPTAGPTASTSHRTVTAAISTPNVASASSRIHVTDSSNGTNPDSALNVFPNANQFEMRDPSFHIAQRDVQIVNVYNITVNQAGPRSTTAAGEPD
ncbi:hypothetical protein NMY22_g10255 [Coprinellus aureogranulatus]|nr:hypothetical protein NMY22_g10255 [Coprinellus aureogranulatus]